MSLIDQLGGYECAAYEYKNTLLADDFPYVIKATGTKFTRPELGDELLEYRRQHNIFEVGDKVVIRKADGHPDLFTYESISKSGNMHFFESPFNYGHLDLCKVRHATDAEVDANRRLDL